VPTVSPDPAPADPQSDAGTTDETATEAAIRRMVEAAYT
jgi:hypothetical protein